MTTEDWLICAAGVAVLSTVLGVAVRDLIRDYRR